MSRAPERRLASSARTNVGVLNSSRTSAAEAQGVDDVADQHNVLGIDPLRNSDSSRTARACSRDGYPTGMRANFDRSS